jgi:hypothetical protein
LGDLLNHNFPLLDIPHNLLGGRGGLLEGDLQHSYECIRAILIIVHLSFYEGSGTAWFKGPKALTTVPPLIHKALPGIFLCIFSYLTYMKKPVFSKMDLLLWKVSARLYWDLLTIRSICLSPFDQGSQKGLKILFAAKNCCKEYTMILQFLNLPT